MTAPVLTLAVAELHTVCTPELRWILSDVDLHLQMGPSHDPKILRFQAQLFLSRTGDARYLPSMNFSNHLQDIAPNPAASRRQDGLPLIG